MFERLHSVVPSDWVVECDYCGETFWGESRHDAHLRETHGDELGPLERRNLTDSSDDTWPRKESGDLRVRLRSLKT